MNQDNKDLAILILAAGESKRLGDITKQLINFNNESFIRNSVKKALNISKNVFVVLGHKNNQCEEEIKDLPVNIIYNEDYKKGIGSSISFGISHTINYNHTLILLCDQPFIPISHYINLKNSIENNKIIASYYNDTLAVPAIFPKNIYPELLELKEDKGAKMILNKYNPLLIKLSKDLALDIDSKSDIKKHLS